MRGVLIRATGWALVGVVSLVLVVVVVAAFGTLPEHVVGLSVSVGKLTANERINADAAARTALLQAVAGVLLVIGAVTAWRQMLIARSQQRLGRRTAVTEAFAKAVEQLAKDDALALRLGGVYAMDRIADDDPTERPRIAEILAAFVRDGVSAQGDPPRDVMAGLQVLTRRDWPQGVDLADTRLEGVRLPAARLVKANLAGAILVAANLRGALLRGADLRGADLRKADLSGCDLREAQLADVRLSAAVADATTSWPTGFVPAKHGVRLR
jgi:hypothetical protein